MNQRCLRSVYQAKFAVSNRSRRIYTAAVQPETQDFCLSSNAELAHKLGVPVYPLSHFDDWLQRVECYLADKENVNANNGQCVSLQKRRLSISVQDMLGFYPPLHHVRCERFLSVVLV